MVVPGGVGGPADGEGRAGGPDGGRPPTAAEARALAHPTRLRIVFACRDRAHTNKELAQLLDTTPGTIHHHLRPLVEEGFLHPEEPRRGPRGSTEQPYRSTGKSWQLTSPATGTLREVATQELLDAAEDDLRALTRVGLTLPPDELAALLAEIGRLLESAKQRSQALDAAGPDAERVAVLFAAHRQPQLPATGDVQRP